MVKTSRSLCLFGTGERGDKEQSRKKNAVQTFESRKVFE